VRIKHDKHQNLAENVKVLLNNQAQKVTIIDDIHMPEEFLSETLYTFGGEEERYRKTGGYSLTSGVRASREF
jgi:hypothetical protein